MCLVGLSLRAAELSGEILSDYDFLLSNFYWILLIFKSRRTKYFAISKYSKKIGTKITFQIKPNRECFLHVDFCFCPRLIVGDAVLFERSFIWWKGFLQIY